VRNGGPGGRRGRGFGGRPRCRQRRAPHGPARALSCQPRYTLQRLATLPEVKGCVAKLRMEGDKPYVTDNSNYIVDLYFEVGGSLPPVANHPFPGLETARGKALFAPPAARPDRARAGRASASA
jgi:hypothetical protein